MTFPTHYVYIVCINEIDDLGGYDLEAYSRKKDAQARADEINAKRTKVNAHVVSLKLRRP